MAAVLCLAAILPQSGATVSIYKVIGRVTDANGNGIQGATVSSSSPAASTTTLSQGYYLLSLPSNGTGVTVTASYQGHSATSSPFDVGYVPQTINLQINDLVIPTPTPTATPAPSATPTAIPSMTPTPGPNSTATPTPSVTITPTATPTPTPAPTDMATPTPNAIASPSTPASTSTPVPTHPPQVSISPPYQPTSKADLYPLTIQAPTPTPGPTTDALTSTTPLPSPADTPLKTQSPGFAMLLAIGCLLGAAGMPSRKK